MNKKLNILITTSWYPTDKSTNGVFVKEQAEALSRAGHTVTVLVVTYTTIGGWFKQEIPQYDPSNLVKLVHVNVVFTLPGRLLSNPQQYFKNSIVKKVHARMKSHFELNGKADIIHHHSLSDNSYLASELSSRFGIPYVFTEHSNYFAYDELNRFNRFETFEDHKRFVLGACKRIGVSEIRANGYEKIFDAPFIVVSNMVKDLFAQPLARNVDPDRFTFVCVAILDKRKRQDVLIHAFTNAFKGQNVFLKLAGSGRDEQAYRRLVEELGMSGQIEFCGKASREEVKVLFDTSQVAVLSSDQETFGVVLAEAMFRGAPVISTICGGPEEVVTPETGILCEKGNAGKFAQAMMQMKDNYSKYDSLQIRNYAMKNFSEEVIIAKLEELYLQCIVKSTTAQ